MVSFGHYLRSLFLIRGVRSSHWVLMGMLGACLGGPAYADSPMPQMEMDLTQLSLEELMSVEVTSVSKKKQKLSESAAAIYVITQEDIRRSGVTSIPEALRMAPGIQVARINNNQWAVSARGFNDRFSNKLLVLIDGRPIYNPLFAGVTWEVQDTILEDIERIEVIRGPGGTLWGVNAVNGVINIITKHSQDTQGVLASGIAGSEEGIVSIRHGGKTGEDLQYRLFTKYFNRDTSFHSGGAHDDTRMFRSGFRTDWKASSSDTVMAQGEFYTGDGGQQNSVATSNGFPFGFTTVNEDVEMSGGHFLGRWDHQFSQQSDMALQLYYDRFTRHEAALKTTIDTFDIDFQHRFALFPQQEVLWGFEYRFWMDDLQNNPTTSAFPDSRSFSLISGFLQDELTLIPDTLTLTVGSKFTHNDFTGFEYQPSGRMLWIPAEGHSLWGAVSRSVRIPSRFEDNAQLNLPASSTVPVPSTIRGNQQLKSEELLAFELGYRLSALEQVSFDITGFYNQYNHIRGSQTVNLFPPLVQVINQLDVQTIGVELASDIQLLDRWRIRGAYSYINIDVDGPANPALNTTGRATPKHQGSIRSLLSLPYNLEFDSWLRVIDNLGVRSIPGYVELDLRLGWKPIPQMDISVVGQNLLDNHHPELFSSFLATQPTEVQRSVYGKITWKF
ncbi:MAG: TonB-dependent receptor [Nitrospirota bacterium]|nr:TonB-dependent receptor [Nitrospirota bacterium]